MCCFSHTLRYSMECAWSLTESCISCSWMTVNSLNIQHTHLHSLLCPRAGAHVFGHPDPIRSTPSRPSAVTVTAQDLLYLLAWFTTQSLTGPNQRQQPAMNACMCCIIFTVDISNHGTPYCTSTIHTCVHAYTCTIFTAHHSSPADCHLHIIMPNAHNIINNLWLLWSDLVLHACDTVIWTNAKGIAYTTTHVRIKYHSPIECHWSKQTLFGTTQLIGSPRCCHQKSTVYVYICSGVLDMLYPIPWQWTASISAIQGGY